MQTTFKHLVGVVLALVLFSGNAHAQYPDRPVRLVLPYAPGGIIDFVGRTVGQRLSDRLGKPVVADNKPGAGGILGTELVAKSPPDGYTILLMDPAIVINPSLQPSMPYDLFKDLQTVSVVSSSPLVLVVSPTLSLRTYQDLVAYGRANPGKLNFASAGIGTTPHLAGEMWRLATGIEATHVPYRGIGASYTDMMSGAVQMAFSSIAGAVPFTSDNRVAPLATTGTARSNVYPQLPTVRESGVSGFEVDLWLGVFAPVGLPPAVLSRLNQDINAILTTAETKAALAKVGVEPRGTSPEEGTTFVRREHEKWARVIREAGVKPN